MIPYEYICNVLLLGCLGLSTLELTKELISHSRVESRRPMIWCSACGGLAMKVHLVAYNDGTSVGHGRVWTLFLEPDFVSSAGTLDVGHGPLKNLFLGLILCLVAMTPCETMLYWPSPN